MLDPAERLIWFESYLTEGMRSAPKPLTGRKRQAIARWAASMAAVAEQFYDPDEDEPAEVDA